MTEFNCNVKTFTGIQNQNAKKGRLHVNINSSCNLLIPIFFSNIDLNYKVENLDLVLANIKAQQLRLADSQFIKHRGNEIQNVHGLLGTDVLQYFLPFSFKRVLNGTVIEVPQGIIPFGNAGNFFTLRQLRTIAELNKGSTHSDNETTVSGDDTSHVTHNKNNGI